MALSPNAGATLWDDAVQSGKSVQTGIPTLTASPEGVIYARPGIVAIVITDDVYMYVKTTDVTLNTGWVGASLTP